MGRSIVGGGFKKTAATAAVPGRFPVRHGNREDFQYASEKLTIQAREKALFFPLLSGYNYKQPL
jgi:hypothetical protein